MFHWFKRHDRNGSEIPDPTPLEIPLDGQRPLTLAQQIARFCESPEVNRVAQEHGVDTFDEANDFYVPDDESEPDFVSRYNTRDMSEEVPTRVAEMEAGHVQPLPPERLKRVQEIQENDAKIRVKAASDAAAQNQQK